MTDQKKTTPISSGLEIELVFDGDTVSGVWYHPDIAPVLCALCGENCMDKSLCSSTNPYCG